VDEIACNSQSKDLNDMLKLKEGSHIADKFPRVFSMDLILCRSRDRNTQREVNIADACPLFAASPFHSNFCAAPPSVTANVFIVGLKKEN
jgi:hypothetical protein